MIKRRWPTLLLVGSAIVTGATAQARFTIRLHNDSQTRIHLTEEQDEARLLAPDPLTSEGQVFGTRTLPSKASLSLTLEDSPEAPWHLLQLELDGVPGRLPLFLGVPKVEPMAIAQPAPGSAFAGLTWTWANVTGIGAEAHLTFTSPGAEAGAGQKEAPAAGAVESAPKPPTSPTATETKAAAVVHTAG